MGFDLYEDARNVFDIRLYLVVILFIVFDLEAVLLTLGVLFKLFRFLSCLTSTIVIYSNSKGFFHYFDLSLNIISKLVGVFGLFLTYPCDFNFVKNFFTFLIS